MKNALSLAAALTLGACTAEETSKTTMETVPTPPPQPTSKVEKSDDEWQKLLTPEQYRILRQAGTERPNGDVYKQFKAQGDGTYYCGGCNAELFTSKEKFDSHCGWPSFYDPSKAKNVVTRDDFSGGMVRTEVLCAKCDGHLGHVFKGEGFDTPTDQRYCINGIALKFVPTSASAKGEPQKDAK
ncbi:MAG: peptide-methionine (R)-S-oxide reductase [Verrucomicrobia bacterium]|nr:MAG: peptide-methionine (R)-S-oxide reductase [Verrucomicrobiota bacterium]TAE88902.1 MAG: peptide-methionine (R)-S-oxide reductase [Verrucomicrobiota bacterium]TAF27319.1 MAG: peptide-methionine (R)-S-oxide reductase [Verrucomicrobiota bacterium]TAF42390.1 MAG: peptide-methionine (R)-S-oxide reductase [Verrucomicrobiota bacterium]